MNKKPISIMDSFRCQYSFKMRIDLILTVFTTVFLCCCTNITPTKKEKNKSSTKYYKIGRHIINEVYDSLGNIQLRQSFNVDTQADGAETTFYPNGKMEKWKWYDCTDKYPYCAVYYGINGNFDSFAGNPFISSVYISNQGVQIQMINPPEVATSLGYKDFHNGKCIDSACYDPEQTDTTAWVGIRNHRFKKKHNYFIFFYFLNANGYILQETRKELVQHL